MEVTFSAIVGDIVSRSFSFFTDKYRDMTKEMEDERLHELQRLLRRANIIVEEAEGRFITNRAMSYQLNILRKEMYMGQFTMDMLRIQSRGSKKDRQDVSNSSSLSRFCPAAKRFFFSVDGTHGKNNGLKRLICNLNDIITDVSELVIFLRNYPPMYRQPYSMHLFVGKCIFGRQMEMDRIIDFLLQKEHPCCTRNVDILPIVGPGNVGKSTLVAHVCTIERVRNHFSQIVIVNGDDINQRRLVTLRDGGRTIHQISVLGENNGRSLLIIEFPGDFDKVAWNSWHLSSLGHLVRGSKIIITSSSDKIIMLGTTQVLRLNFLPLEAYWYFFKILIFGSGDPNDHPKLESIAMDLAREMSGSFVTAYSMSGILGYKLRGEYWRLCLAVYKEHITRNITLFGEHPHHLAQKRKPICYRINNDELFVCYNFRASYGDDDSVPAVTVSDVLTGKFRCEDSFEVLAWKSPVLSYKAYIANGKIARCTTYSRFPNILAANTISDS